jgi:hypothetical protein
MPDMPANPEDLSSSSSLLSPGEGRRFQRPRDGKLEEVSLSEFLQWADESAEQVAHLSDGKSWTIHLLVRGLRSSAQALRAATEEIAKWKYIADLEGRAKDRYMPCPDCRDKVHGECYRCLWQAATERAEQAEKDRDCYLKNLEDAQGDIAAEVAANQRLREQFKAAEQLRVEALALVEQWREQAKLNHARGNQQDHARESQSYSYGSEHAFDQCADELASLLTRPPKE